MHVTRRTADVEECLQDIEEPKRSTLEALRLRDPPRQLRWRFPRRLLAC
jgi:hypothetical protein